MTAPAVRAPRIARHRTYDPVLRVIHGVMALSITVIVAVFALGDLLGDRADGDTVALLHTAAGFILVGALLARLVWGMVGPHEARLARLWHPRVWVEAIRRRQFPHASGFGHHPAASVAYLAFYAAIAYLSVSGIVMAGAEFDIGPATWWTTSRALRPLAHALGEAHEGAALVVVGFIAAHLLALVWHERRDGVPVAQAMISGYQYRSESEVTGEHVAR